MRINSYQIVLMVQKRFESRSGIVSQLEKQKELKDFCSVLDSFMEAVEASGFSADIDEETHEILLDVSGKYVEFIPPSPIMALFYVLKSIRPDVEDPESLRFTFSIPDYY